MTSDKSAEASFPAWFLEGGAPQQACSSLRLAKERAAATAPPNSDERLWPGQWRSGQVITNPVRQMQILESLCVVRASGMAYDPLSHERLGPVQLREDGTLLVPSSLEQHLLLVQLVSYHAAYCMSWDATAGFALDSMEMFAERIQKRGGVSSRVKLRFAMPGVGKVEGVVLDVSNGGLSFTVDGSAQLPVERQVLRDCSLTWKGGSDLPVKLEVVHVSHHGPSARVGARLIATPEGWTELVEDLLFPETKRGNVDANVVWSAYVASGYFNISGKDSRCFEAGRQEFQNAQDLLGRAPHVGALFSGGRRIEPEAYIHHVQAWPGAWINVHLCRLAQGRTLRTSDDGLLLRLYEHCYGFALGNAETRWLVTYTHSRDTAYSHRLHCEFARGLRPTQGCVVGFEAIELVGVAEPGDDAATAAPTELENEAVRQALLRQLPLPYLKAMSYLDADLGVAAMGRIWQGSGLERGREVLVSRHLGRVVAAAVIDYAARGMHVYGLLDKVRLIAVEPQGYQAFDQLLEAAYNRNARRGQHKLIYFRDLDAPCVGDRLSHSSLGNAHINVVAREQFGEFFEHVFQLHVRTMNHYHGDEKSYSVAPVRGSMVRSLAGKCRTDGLLETRA